MIHVQTGNMLDVIVDGKSIGLKQRDSDHRKHEIIWLPEPAALRDVLDAEIKRIAAPEPQSPRVCVDCLHNENVDGVGPCQVYVSNWRKCLCKCVFPEFDSIQST